MGTVTVPIINLPKEAVLKTDLMEDVMFHLFKRNFESGDLCNPKPADIHLYLSTLGFRFAFAENHAICDLHLLV